jgi:hypothetical protein
MTQILNETREPGSCGWRRDHGGRAALRSPQGFGLADPVPYEFRRDGIGLLMCAAAGAGRMVCGVSVLRELFDDVRIGSRAAFGQGGEDARIPVHHDLASGVSDAGDAVEGAEETFP